MRADNIDAAIGDSRAAPAAAPVQVRVRNLVKRFKTRRGEVVALDHVSIDIAKSERVVLLGPSGCGKTTLLRCVAGLEKADEGEIEVDGRTVFSASRGIFVPPQERGISMMFQSYALWPHMSVAGNVSFPLENRAAAASRGEHRRRVDAALAMVGCDGLQNRFPAQLSGGQQQRIALARAVVAGDAMVLFDEPLSNVDAKVREQLRLELVTLQRQLGFAWLYVTHDQTEATAVADRIAVFRSGRIAQLGTPTQIYNEPASLYVADFVGSSNALKGTVEGAEDGLIAVRSEIGALRVRSATGPGAGERVTLVFRPEQIEIKKAALPGALGEANREVYENSVEGQVEAAMFLGNCTEYVVRVGSTRVVSRSLDAPNLRPQDTVTLSIGAHNVRMFAEQAEGAAQD